MSSHRRPDTRRLPAACPACLRLLRLAHTRIILGHSSTERPASSASALSAATVSGLHSLPLARHACHSSTERPASYALALSAAIASGLHSSQAHQLHGEHAQKASAGETALLHTSQVPAPSSESDVWESSENSVDCQRQARCEKKWSV